MKLLVTGGTGLLGKEILKLDKDIFAPTHSEMDIRLWEDVLACLEKYEPDCILHLAAATNPPQHEVTPSLGIDTNIIGTAHIAYFCSMTKVRLVYLSTDYVYTGNGPHTEKEGIFAPSRFVWSKIGGEAAVAMVPNHLLIRCSFGCRPFPHPAVYDNQLNSKMYVDEIAPFILEAAKSTMDGIVNIGSDGQTLEEYARRTVPDILTIPTPQWVPKDTRLDTTRWKSRSIV